MAKEVNCPDYEKAEDGIESDAEFLVGKKNYNFSKIPNSYGELNF